MNGNMIVGVVAASISPTDPTVDALVDGREPLRTFGAAALCPFVAVVGVVLVGLTVAVLGAGRVVAGGSGTSTCFCPALTVTDAAAPLNVDALPL
jgi:hypothetical protein